MARPLIIATRGSALALAQSNMMKAACEAAMPGQAFELRIVKTTGDKLQAVAPTTQTLQPTQSTKGLFTKELEVALLNGEADLAVHSLKDLPTELPEGLVLAATPKREDVRDVLITTHPLQPSGPVQSLPANTTIATSSTRRAAQLQALRPDLKIVPIRGNVGTRIKKLLTKSDLGGTILAVAGLNRLQLKITPDHTLTGQDVPAGIRAYVLPLEEMLPCVGQAAIAIEIRANDPILAPLCEKLNHADTFSCVTAERAFLRAMGGGCLSPVAAHATIAANELRLRAVALKQNTLSRAELSGPIHEAATLGATVAGRI